MKSPLILILLVVSVTSYSQVFVKSNATGLNNGTSWQNAYKDLSVALNSTSSGQVWVAAGTYLPSTDINGVVPPNYWQKTFVWKKGVSIYGGFSGTETSLDQRNIAANKTILSGDSGVKGSPFDNCGTVISNSGALDINTILDGVTISDGAQYLSRDGGGMHMEVAGKFVVRNCIFERNWAYGSGGAMYVLQGSPVLENNIFKSNQAYSGGAIALESSNAIVRNNEFTDNKVDDLPGVTSTQVFEGGALYVESSSARITGNVFKGNSSKKEGGAIFIKGNYNPLLESNQIIGNTAAGLGGGVYTNTAGPFMINNVIAKNVARAGGGIFIAVVNSMRIVNNTIADNSVTESGAGIYIISSGAVVSNTIIYGNSTSSSKKDVFVAQTDQLPTFINCDIKNGQAGISSSATVSFTGFDVDPNYTASSLGDYTLTGASALIDGGTLSSKVLDYPWKLSDGSTVTFGDKDIAGKARVYGSAIDLGAYEVQHYSPEKITISAKSVEWTAAVGTTIGSLTTTDKDSDNFTYEIVGENKYFSLAGNVLKVASPLKDVITSPANITVKATDETGLFVSNTISIDVLNIVIDPPVIDPPITGLEDGSLEIKLFPNRTTGIVYFDGPVAKGSSITVYSVQGMRMMDVLIDGPSFDIQSLSAGLYVAVLATNNTRHTFRIIKE